MAGDLKLTMRNAESSTRSTRTRTTTPTDPTIWASISTTGGRCARSDWPDDGGKVLHRATSRTAAMRRRGEMVSAASERSELDGCRQHSSFQRRQLGCLDWPCEVGMASSARRSSGGADGAADMAASAQNGRHSKSGVARPIRGASMAELGQLVGATQLDFFSYPYSHRDSRL